MTKKIISYNLNGIRAALKKGLTEWLAEEKPDILCIQETKAQPEQIDIAAFEALDYYCYSYSAQKKGYSGVAIFTREQPDMIVYGMNNPKYDSEGRVLRADYNDLSVISVYIPSGSMGDERQAFKMEFLSDFQAYIDQLRKERPQLIISGDYNICHKAIDINNPKKHEKVSGFLPEERQWLDGFIDSGFVDTFRCYNQEAEQYSWWSYRSRAREKNLGWRIDYHLVTENIRERLQHADILQDVYHSDHCPVLVEIDF